MSGAEHAERLRALHRPGDPLLLVNAWDPPSARRLAQDGYPAIATTSAGVAEALGYEDGNVTPPDEMLGAVARIAAVVDVPVTADLEAGYGLEPPALVRGSSGRRRGRSQLRGHGPRCGRPHRRRGPGRAARRDQARGP
ncbi:MAG TPA: isocitrate lyase/phosphoenolpyruvate mutase family protein [Thermoleophilaceae bacterium]